MEWGLSIGMGIGVVLTLLLLTIIDNQRRRK